MNHVNVEQACLRQKRNVTNALMVACCAIHWKLVKSVGRE